MGQVYIVRNKTGELRMFNAKPERNKAIKFLWIKEESSRFECNDYPLNAVWLRYGLRICEYPQFKDLTFEDDPVLCRIDFEIV